MSSQSQIASNAQPVALTRPHLSISGLIEADNQEYVVNVRLLMDDEFAGILTGIRAREGSGQSDAIYVGHMLQIESNIPWPHEWDGKLVVFKAGTIPALQLRCKNSRTGAIGGVRWHSTETSQYAISLVGLAVDDQQAAFCHLMALQRPTDDYAAMVLALLARERKADFVHAMADAGFEFYALPSSAVSGRQMDDEAHAWLRSIYRERELSAMPDMQQPSSSPRQRL